MFPISMNGEANVFISKNPIIPNRRVDLSITAHSEELMP